MNDDMKWAIIELYEGLSNYYPAIYRMGGEAASKETVRFWKAQLGNDVNAQDLRWFSSTYLGRGIFESIPPKPHLLKLIIDKKGHKNFDIAVRFDQMMHAYYMSLYAKDPGVRLERIEEYSHIFEEEEVGFSEVDRLASKIKRSSAWRSYPPSMYDVRSLIIRNKLGIDSFEAEFANYCTKHMTPCVRAITRIIGQDNLRLMGLDAQERIFRKIYFALDEKEWKEISSTRNVDPEQGDDEEVVSKENTLSVFDKKE